MPTGTKIAQDQERRQPIRRVEAPAATAMLLDPWITAGAIGQHTDAQARAPSLSLQIRNNGMEVAMKGLCSGR